MTPARRRAQGRGAWLISLLLAISSTSEASHCSVVVKKPEKPRIGALCAVDYWTATTPPPADFRIGEGIGPDLPPISWPALHDRAGQTDKPIRVAVSEAASGRMALQCGQWGLSASVRLVALPVRNVDGERLDTLSLEQFAAELVDWQRQFYFVGAATESVVGMNRVSDWRELPDPRRQGTGAIFIVELSRVPFADLPPGVLRIRATSQEIRKLAHAGSMGSARTARFELPCHWSRSR